MIMQKHFFQQAFVMLYEGLNKSFLCVGDRVTRPLMTMAYHGRLAASQLKPLYIFIGHITPKVPVQSRGKTLIRMVRVTAKGGVRDHSFLAKHPRGTIYLHNTLCTIFSSSLFITRVQTITSVLERLSTMKKNVKLMCGYTLTPVRTVVQNTSQSIAVFLRNPSTYLHQR